METYSSLEIGERDQSHLESGTDRLAAVGGAQFPKDVVQVTLNRGRRQSYVLRQALSGVTLGDPTQNLHFSGRQRHS